jgi:inward rectifier potassium channel
VANRKSVQPVVDARGRLLLERRGLPAAVGAALAKDAYHFLRTATWTRITLLFGGLFLVVNLVFAAILYLGRAEVMNAHGFADDFWFSVQTLATIGYGVLAPADTLSHVVVTIESLLGIGLTALMTGVFFARFATASARVIFSRVAVVHEHEGKPTLMFRMANERETAIVEATVRVYLSRDEKLASGERIRRIYDLPLRRSTSPIFALSWTVYHVLDETSPLYGLNATTLTDGTANLMITFQGIDDRLAATIHTRYGYNPSNLVFGHRFVDILHLDPENGVRYIDIAKIHETEPLPPRPELPQSPSETEARP